MICPQDVEFAYILPKTFRDCDCDHSISEEQKEYPLPPSHEISIMGSVPGLQSQCELYIQCFVSRSGGLLTSEKRNLRCVHGESGYRDSWVILDAIEDWFVVQEDYNVSWILISLHKHIHTMNLTTLLNSRFPIPFKYLPRSRPAEPPLSHYDGIGTSLGVNYYTSVFHATVKRAPELWFESSSVLQPRPDASQSVSPIDVQVRVESLRIFVVPGKTDKNESHPSYSYPRDERSV